MPKAYLAAASRQRLQITRVSAQTYGSEWNIRGAAGLG